MADLKISALTGASTPLAGTEVLPIVQSGSTVKVSVANLTAGRAVATAGGSFTDNITQSTAAKGINFTANTPAAGMTSQLLNWYEEGTWTPTFSSGVTSPVYELQNGYYTRIGNRVLFSIRLKLSSGSGAAAQLKISGLPFTSTANPNFGGGYVTYLNNFTTSPTFTTLIAQSSTTVDFYKNDGTSFLGTDVANITNTIILNGSYSV